MKYTQIGNIILVGTSHIADESVKNVKVVIEHFPEAIVGVELDKQRFYALIHNQKSSGLSFETIKLFGWKGAIFAAIASAVTEKLAKHVGTKPGADMLAAIETAKKKDLTVGLLDQPIQITLQRFSQKLTWKEKWNFFVDIITGLVMPNKAMKKYGLAEFNLKKVPPDEVIEKLLEYVEKRYPEIYKVLITERNSYMVRRIQRFQEKYPTKTIIAVVGAGHVKGMKELLEHASFK